MTERYWIAFTDLKEGERFVFVYGIGTQRQRSSPVIYTKTKGGWFTDGRRKFRTSKFTAVSPITESK